jgi:hypothetical protein
MRRVANLDKSQDGPEAYTAPPLSVSFSFPCIPAGHRGAERERVQFGAEADEYRGAGRRGATAAVVQGGRLGDVQAALRRLPAMPRGMGCHQEGIAVLNFSVISPLFFRKAIASLSFLRLLCHWLWP